MHARSAKLDTQSRDVALGQQSSSRRIGGGELFVPLACKESLHGEHVFLDLSNEIFRI
jgi:hypothetical protein